MRYCSCLNSQVCSAKQSTDRCTSTQGQTSRTCWRCKRSRNRSAFGPVMSAGCLLLATLLRAPLIEFRGMNSQLGLDDSLQVSACHMHLRSSSPVILHSCIPIDPSVVESRASKKRHCLIDVIGLLRRSSCQLSTLSIYDTPNLQQDHGFLCSKTDYPISINSSHVQTTTI